MGNFDLRKYLAEGKLHEVSNPIWKIGKHDDSADIDDAGPEYKAAVVRMIKKDIPDIPDKAMNHAIGVINDYVYREARNNAKGSDPEILKWPADEFAIYVVDHYNDRVEDEGEYILRENVNKDDSYYIDEIKRDLEELDDKEANEYLEELAKSILKLKR